MGKEQIIQTNQFSALAIQNITNLYYSRSIVIIIIIIIVGCSMQKYPGQYNMDRRQYQQQQNEKT